MLSVIIATLDSERRLVPTLAALVSGATDGLISEVLLADGGSRDDVAIVADVAGCKLLALERPLGPRLKAAAATARAPWLLFLRPGTILDAPWTGEARRFVGRHWSDGQAAVFRRAGDGHSALRELFATLAAALGRRPRPEQGLLIARRAYEALGGHSADAADPESDLIRRIGRRRIATLSSGAVTAPDT